jgi:alkylhydroperoxidase/carboxymuconolactone decarboxylase family protein YurZ
VPLGSPMQEFAPDQWRIICEVCFGWVWNRPNLSMMQRSLATISIITALRRDDNLKGHLHSGLEIRPETPVGPSHDRPGN